MKTSTLLALAVGVGVVGYLVMGRARAAALAPVTPPAAPSRPKGARDLAAMFDPTSSSAPFGAPVRDLVTDWLSALKP